MDWLKLALCVAGAVLSGLLIYHVVAGYYHLRYYRRRRDEATAWKIQPKRFLSDKHAREAARSGTLNLTLGGALSGVLVYAILEHGLPTRLYTDVHEYGLPYFFASIVGVWLLIDLLAYYVHRALHIRWIYKRVHRFHHKFVAPTPYAALALHPVELLALQAASISTIFYVPMHVGVISGVLVYTLVFNIVDHSGVDLRSRLPWQAPPRYHDDHHVHFHVNFGQHLMLWDRLHGTLRRVRRTYGQDVFGGRGVSTDETGETVATELPPFVSY